MVPPMTGVVVVNVIRAGWWGANVVVLRLPIIGIGHAGVVWFSQNRESVAGTRNRQILNGTRGAVW